MDKLTISIAQLNPTMGDLSGNLSIALSAHGEAEKSGSDIIVFSELFLSGYPPEDLVLKPSFVASCRDAIMQLCSATKNSKTGIVIGSPWRENDNLYNSAIVIDSGDIISVHHKVDLPNYGVFDEKRTFVSGSLSGPVNFRDIRLGIAICEDTWGDYGVCETLSEGGAEIILVLNGSPYCRDILETRRQVVIREVLSSELPIAYINQVGGQDELVFDGASFILNSDNSLAVQLPQFASHIESTDWHREGSGWRCVSGAKSTLLDSLSCDWQASVMGVRDYVEKNGFANVLLGLSGGIDSAVCAAICVDALGSDRVKSIMLPYLYTSEQSLDDASACAKSLGISCDTVDISRVMDSLTLTLKDTFAPSGITQENLQSRTRGILLMAYSNHFGSLVITTGNKSELSVGYATLYGDMNGGYNPIKDFYKTEVFALANWRNEQGVVIPQSIIDKPPSAELRADQKDSDSLPDYETLDCILRNLVEGESSVDDIVAKYNFDKDIVRHIQHLLYMSEYKRRQAAPGAKVTARSFGRERRYPITNRFRDTDK